jgi:hypothetical protein
LLIAVHRFAIVACHVISMMMISIFACCIVVAHVALWQPLLELPHPSAAVQLLLHSVPLRVSSLQALAAHLINFWDKSLLFRSAAAAAGAGAGHHLLSMLQVKGSCRLSLPVLRDNLNRVLRGTGGGAGAAGRGSVVHISSAEDSPDNDSELVSRDCSRLCSVQKLHVSVALMLVALGAG